MIAALERESGKAGIDHSTLLNEISQRTSKAEALASSGELDTARNMLDENYHRLTATLAQTIQATAPAAPRNATGQSMVTDSESKASRNAVERELTSATALLAALKNQAPSPSTSTAAAINEVEDVLSNARKALDNGDTSGAATMVHEAYLKTTASIRALQKPSTLKSGGAALAATQNEQATSPGSESDKQSYVRKRDGLVAMIDASQRITSEKGLHKPNFQDAESLLKQADALAASGQHAKGRNHLDLAYAQVKATLQALRQGEELKADKNFASKADEFRYEQAVNDDYLALITALGRDGSDVHWAEEIGGANGLRVEANEAGKSGDFETGVSKLVASTSRLKKLLRLAGFPIISN